MTKPWKPNWNAVLKSLVALSLLFSGTKATSSPVRLCNDDEYNSHPVLCRKVGQLIDNPDLVFEEIHTWARDHGLLVDPRGGTKAHSFVKQSSSSASIRGRSLVSDDPLPVVMAHGMGDSCFNDGMQSVVKHISKMLNDRYVVCIPTGNSQAEDTNNGYFLNWKASVAVFAEKIQQDPKLKNGFYAIGFSQGNNVIRGYIADHNAPTVHTFISVNGVNAGVGAVPYCRPSVTSSLSLPSMCDLLMEQASRAAYTDYAQQHSFQANYWRDARAKEFETYQQHAQLAYYNNEVTATNKTLNDNWALTQKFVWVMANEDEMVWPKEGEHWGAPDPKNPFQHVLPRNQTDWYLKDLFGLKTAEEAGKNHYESFDGGHLQFTWDQFDGWIHKYLS